MSLFKKVAIDFLKAAIDNKKSAVYSSFQGENRIGVDNIGEAYEMSQRVVKASIEKREIKDKYYSSYTEFNEDFKD